MNLFFDQKLVTEYTSESQKVRVMTENWVGMYAYCPSCGLHIDAYKNNKPVADFYCKKCLEDYELKSKKNSIGKKIVDGAFGTMIERLESSTNPNFFLLNYDVNTFSVKDFFVIPKHFFTPKIIEARLPLRSSARRAGWVGCNILLHNIPQAGKIFYVKHGEVISAKNVISQWEKTVFLEDNPSQNAKGWLLDIMLCIDVLNKKEFSLSEMYEFESKLAKLHPDNKYIKDKIRQQLQVLRDKGYLEFLGGGKYCLI